MVKTLTPYPEVNTLLNLLLTRTRAVLGPQFVGLYLYGSLATGDFDPTSSDLDFAVVTETQLPPETLAALEALHAELWASGLKWAAKLEGSYLPRSLIRRHDPAGPPCPTVNEGSFFIDQRGSDWVIQRHVIRECGVVLAGPDPKTLIDPVSADQIRQAILGILQEWWFPMLANPTWLRAHGSAYHAFAVMTMCRVLHGLETGTIVSKPAAARWTQAKYPQWQALIDQASASQSGSQPGFIDQALELIQFVKDRLESG